MQSLSQSPPKSKPELVEAEEDSVFLARIQSLLTEGKPMLIDYDTKKQETVATVRTTQSKLFIIIVVL